MSPKNGISFNGVLAPKLLNNPFASCSFVNLDFSLSHTSRFDDSIGLPFLAFKIFESAFFFLYLFCTLSNFSTCFTMISAWKV